VGKHYTATATAKIQWEAEGKTHHRFVGMAHAPAAPRRGNRRFGPKLLSEYVVLVDRQWRRVFVDIGEHSLAYYIGTNRERTVVQLYQLEAPCHVTYST
jgi:hypothetical protein